MANHQPQPSESPAIDLLVVGGGIVGAGVARDAAMRGLRTVVIDRRDFAFGTSSRSSRLLHGGLRYLSQGRIGLVREASVEKLTLSRIAPHLAMPLPFVFPTYRGAGWPRWSLRLGVKIYDVLCGGDNLGRSQGLDADGVAAAAPGISTGGLTGGVRYYDGFTSDCRLVIDTLRSAAAAGATAANYSELVSAVLLDELWHCVVRNPATPGIDGAGGAPERTILARSVVNAAGAWADRLPPSRVRLRLTKGVHLVVDQSRLPMSQAVVLTDGPRILFTIPWGERVILGTTDTDYAGPLDAPDCNAADVAAVLSVVNRGFPLAGLTPADVISTWAGLRPLIADSGGRPSDISRAHQILAGDPGWFDVAGGKLTTYRRMAEQAVDRVVRHLRRRAGRKRPAAGREPAFARCRTASEPLLMPGDERRFTGVLPPPVSPEAVAHYCRQEWARHLDDVMIRRSTWRYYHPEHARIAEQVAGWMQQSLSWDEQRKAQELTRYGALTAAGFTA